MTKSFLTKTQAGSKLNASGLSGLQLVTKQQCLDNGADPAPLTPYVSTAYPVDDHIVKKTIIIKRAQMSFSIQAQGLPSDIHNNPIGTVIITFFTN